MRPVMGLDPSSGNGDINTEMGPGLGSDHVPSTINIKVYHGDNEYEVAVPSDSSFGHLRSVMGQKIGLKPELLKLLFRGVEKEDVDSLQTAGVKNNSKVSLINDISSEQKSTEEVKETSAISIGGAAVAEVREEVSKLKEKVSVLKVVVDSGNKVDEKDLLYLTEMLMRQLLKLDGIEAEGEGKVQRKQEVRRVQSLVETMDILKSKNSNIASDTDNTQPLSILETIEPDSGSSDIPPPVPPSAPSPAPAPSSVPYQAAPSDSSVAPHSNPPVTPPLSNLYPEPYSNTHAELHSNPPVSPPLSNLYPAPYSNTHAELHSNHYSEPYSNHNSLPHSNPYSAPHSNIYSEPNSSPYPVAATGHYAYPHSSYHPNYAEPHSAPGHVPYYAPSPPLSYSAPYHGQYTSPPPAAHNPYPYPVPHSNPPYPPSAPYPPSYSTSHSYPHHMPSSSTTVTQNWERFE